MTGTASDTREDAFWWQGSLMRIKARAAETGGALGLVEGQFPAGFGPPLHVHRNEDEGLYVMEGKIRFRHGDKEFVAGPGTLVWGRRGEPHAFKVEPGGARALVIVVPGGLEQMFEEAGVSAHDRPEPPADHYDVSAVRALAGKFGFEVVGPPLP